ncbi:branched-chain amino acid ABC transporter permease [Halovivax cerinus]|uniref:Branched-chain amino acid ABC transporter permease n=1 Tax=Halovivax cerinus TaxID=1487865 RepID=A0ABD5NSR5_9EURY|nr:branched-chain amino acid ABC transporter permease [Halovivax cerinus]
MIQAAMQRWIGVRGRTTKTAVALGIVLILGLIAADIVRGQLSAGTVGVYLWQGVIIGLVIGLAGVGLTLTYSILGFANFAHGEYLTVGAFGGWVATFVVAGIGTLELSGLLLLGFGSSEVNAGSAGVNVATAPAAIVVGAGFAAVVTMCLALALDRIVYRPMREQDGIALLIASIGVAFILRYALVLVFGTEQAGLTTGSGPDVSLPAVGVSASAHELTLIVAAIALVVGLHLLLQRTKLGIAMRAMADSESLARVTGIPTERVVRDTWLIGAGLTGVSGYLLVLWRGSISFDIGWNILLLVFAAVILGGIGSVYGAIVGGLVIGVASRLSLIWLPAGFVNVTAFLVMILVLIVRPRGIFSGRSST